jgi:protein-L-isoaspartate(D-aspartate) O-methyltransferase
MIAVPEAGGIELGAPSDAEERAQFMLRMRARGIQDLGVLRALERAPRALFIPQRYSDMSARDIVLPIGCGQTLPPPSVVAAMIQVLDIDRSHSVLEIGAGTGYATALLAQLASQVLSLERCQTLALEASARLEAFGLKNAQVAWADGLATDPGAGRFDRIIVHGLIEASHEGLFDLLAESGALVAVMSDDGSRDQRIVRLARGADGALVPSEHGPARAYSALVPGLARGL